VEISAQPTGARFTLAGTPVPPMALGAMYFGTRVPTPRAHDLLDRATDLGATFVDTANNYAFWEPGGTGDESETCLGAWFATRGARDRVLLATKVGARPAHPGGDLSDAIGLSAQAVRSQVEDSLRRLRTDHVDVVYAHFDDRSVALAETVEAFQDLVFRGLARAIAASNITGDRLRAAVDIAGDGPRYAAVQNRFTYLRPCADLAPHVPLDEHVAAQARGREVLPVAYAVLLEGAYTRPDRPLPTAYGDRTRNADALAALDKAAKDSDLDAGQTVLAWMTQRPEPVLPIVGVSRVDQLTSAWKAVHTPLSTSALDTLERSRRGDSG
jgi:aryl-alcohol dehydrogenase-like predicted oxidoreductase